MGITIEAFFMIFAIASLAGQGYAQTAEELAAIRTTVDGLVENNPIYQGIPTEFDCKSNAKRWILGCLDLLRFVDPNLGAALNTVAQVQDGDGNVVMNGNALKTVMLQDGVTMTMDCCAPLCLLAKAGCGCKENVYSGMVELVGGDENIANEVLELQASRCTSDIPALTFEHTLRGNPQCDESYVPIAKSWTCA